MLAPRRAELREGELPRREAEGALKATTGDENRAPVKRRVVLRQLAIWTT